MKKEIQYSSKINVICRNLSARVKNKILFKINYLIFLRLATLSLKNKSNKILHSSLKLKVKLKNIGK